MAVFEVGVVDDSLAIEEEVCSEDEGTCEVDSAIGEDGGLSGVAGGSGGSAEHGLTKSVAENCTPGGKPDVAR